MNKNTTSFSVIFRFYETYPQWNHLSRNQEFYSDTIPAKDVVGDCPPQGKRSSARVSQLSLPFLTSVEEAHWLSPDNPEDCRLYLRTRAAPRSRVQVDWSISQRGLLPRGLKRDYYEVEIVTGTPLTSIRSASWVTDDPHDLRLRIWSEGESPFRWFKAEWRAYTKESRHRKVIDEIPGETPLGTKLGS